MGNVEKKLAEMGVTLQAMKDAGTILHGKRSGNLLFISGHGTAYVGKVGSELTQEQGYQAAREAAIHCLEAVKLYVGDLDKVTSVVKLLGMVNCAPDFGGTPAVINGATELLIQAFGPEIGYHARSAVGMASLPGGIAVEVEMIVEVEN